ncbi:MAG: hypothetical protein ACTSRR_02065 [Candidatus Heimdallarchaeaceae archaeon]
MNFESPIYVKREQASYLFSRGILATRLEVIGLEFQQAYELSNKIYLKIKKLSENTVSKNKLDEFVYDSIKEEYSEELAEEYLTIEKLRDTNIPLWIVIAGAIGVGKSTLSRKIASDFGIRHVIGTDIVRDILRKTLSKDIAPQLHSPSYLAYKTLRPIYSTCYDEVIIGYENHSKYVNIGIEALLNRAAMENISIIIEGEHLLPSFFDKETIKISNLIYITISLENEKMHLENLSSQYSREKEELIKNFKNIRKIHDFLVHETKIRKLPVIEAKDKDVVLANVRKYIIEKAKKIVF